VKAFVWGDAREIPDGEGVRRARVGLVTVEPDAERDHADALPVEAQAARHLAGAELAHGHEPIDALRVPTNQRQRIRPVRLAEPVQEDVLALERAADRHLQGSLDGRRQRDQQRVGAAISDEGGENAPAPIPRTGRRA
jgi:hypothetical protein